MERESRTHNSPFAIGGVSCSADSLVVAESSVLRMGICGKKPAHRQSAKRCWQGYHDTRHTTDNTTLTI
jgi:hypothetical protein